MNSALKKILPLFLLCIISNNTTFAQIQVEKIFRKVAKKFKKGGSSEWTLDDAVVHPDFQVVGIEPTWCVPLNKYEHYYFNAVSTIVVGQYDINPETGLTRHYPSLMDPLFGHKVEKKNEKISFVSQAKKLNPNIHVNVALFFQGNVRQHDFLKGESYVNGNNKGDFRQPIIDTLNVIFQRLYNEYNIDYDHSGILVNIEDIPINKNKGIDKSKEYFAFINYLIERMERHKINVKIPRSFYSKPELKPEFEKIEEHINSFIVQAYDDYSKASNPVNMERVEGMISIVESLGVPKEKIIVEFPNFGNMIKDGKSKPISLDKIQRVVGASGQVSYNREGDSATFLDSNDSTQYFFDDAVTFNNKIATIQEQGISGIAMYGLGYNTIKTDDFFMTLKNNKFLKKKESLYLFLAGFVGLFFPLGMLYSVVNSWEVRNALAKYSRLNRIFWMTFVGFLTFALLLFFAGNMLVMVVGIVVVGIFMLQKLIRKTIGRIKKILKYGKYVGM